MGPLAPGGFRLSSRLACVVGACFESSLRRKGAVVIAVRPSVGCCAVAAARLGEFPVVRVMPGGRVPSIKRAAVRRR